MSTILSEVPRDSLPANHSRYWELGTGESEVYILKSGSDLCFPAFTSPTLILV